MSALQLSLLVVAIVVPLNVLFGVPTALVLARNRFRGKSVLQAVIDLPFAVSPVVVGVALILLWGTAGIFGFVENDLGFKIIFGFPGIVLASIFVTVPFVIREVEPVLHELGTDQEEAAATLGSQWWQTFWRITLPSIRWGLTYGIVLTVARTLGEFGAVIMVSSNLPGTSQTLTLLVADRYSRGDEYGAYAVSTLLMGVAVLVLIVQVILDARRAQRQNRTQLGPKETLSMTNAITVRGANKHYGDFAALDNVDFDVPCRLADRAARAQRVGQVDAAARHRRPGPARHRHDHHQRRGRHAHPAAAARHRLRVPALRGVQAPDGPRQRRLRPEDPQAAEGRDQGEGRQPARGGRAGGFQTRYPNQLSGGQRQRMALARALAVDPQVLLLDEPFGALDAKVREDLRAWLRRLHDEVHVTTVLVTHDQAEALDVADRIAVLNKGRIEQVGSPTEVYDTPANAFVMSFLGAVSSLNGTLVRPHDIRVGRNPDMAIASSDDTGAGHRGAEGHDRPNRHAGLRGSRRTDQRRRTTRRSPRRSPAATPRRSGSKEGDTVYVRATRVPTLPGGTDVPTADTADEDEALTKADADTSGVNSPRFIGHFSQSITLGASAA